MSVLVKVTSGSQTFRRSSGKLSAFVMKCDDSHRRELHSKVLTANGSGTYIKAHRNDLNEHGTYVAKTFEAKEGQILCLQAQTSKGGGPYSQGMLLIYLREDGPLLTVDFLPIPDRDSSIERIEVFSGRGDILTKDELPEYGISLNKIQLKNFFDQEELDEVFDIKVLDEGTPKPTKKVIKDAEGNDHVIRVPSKARRKIRIK
jgi:hypothetical protein